MASVLVAASYSRIGFSICLAVRARRVRVPGGINFHMKPGTIEGPNYDMRMRANVGRLLADDTCKETVRRWKENGEDVVNNFKYRQHLIVIFITAMWLMITTASGIQCHQFRIHG